MTKEEITAILIAAGGGVLALWKGLPPILESLSKVLLARKELKASVGKVTPAEPLQLPVITHKLASHPMFALLRQMQTQASLHISTGNLGKDKILQSIIHTKLQAYIDELYKVAVLLDEGCTECCLARDCMNLFDLNMQAFDRAYSRYTTYWVNNSDFTDDERWCLDYVMPIFNKEHQSNIDITQSEIQHFCTTRYYNNCKSRQDGIFAIYVGAFQRTMIEMECTFNNINGHLRGKVFKGVEI